MQDFQSLSAKNVAFAIIAETFHVHIKILLENTKMCHRKNMYVEYV